MSASTDRPPLAAAPVSTGPKGTLSAENLGEAFGGKIEPIRTSLLYRLGLLLVAVAMLLLPLIYIGLVALVIYGVYLHATQNIAIFQSRGGGTKGKLLVYLAPLIAGAIIILFMIKPLFARPGKRPPRLVLRPKEEPLLFAFVSRVCAAVGSPLPKEIEVDCQVNASASFRRGLRSLLGDDLVLTIGLPLVAGLDLRGFAGVLAHEFGHFSQGAGMRLTYIIRSVDHWFARVVYERDSWDERLVQWSKEIDVRIGIILYLTRLLVWLTRRILWGLMMVGNGISCFMLRQMEFDADLHEIRLAGSEAFTRTARRLPLLAVSSRAAFADLGESWKEGRLGDDFTALVLSRLKKMPAGVRKEVLEQSGKARTGLLDTHPADPDRIRQAEREGARGIFHLEIPATRLFRDFPGLSRRASLAFYEGLLGPDTPVEANLVPVDSIIEEGEELEAGLRAYRRYFGDCLDEDLPLTLGKAPPEPPADLAAASAEAKRLRAMVEPVLPRARSLHGELREARGKLAKLDVAGALLEGGAGFEPAKFGIPRRSPEAIDEARKEVDGRLAALRKKLEPLEKLQRSRLSLAVALLGTPRGKEIAGKAGGGADGIAGLLEALDGLAACRGTIADLGRTCLENRLLAGCMPEKGEPAPKLLAAISARARAWHRQLSLLREGLAGIRYPFPHPQGAATLAQISIGPVPRDPSDIGPLFEAANETLDRLRSLDARLRARLAALAEAVEEGIAGLARLPDPPEEADGAKADPS